MPKENAEAGGAQRRRSCKVQTSREGNLTGKRKAVHSGSDIGTHKYTRSETPVGSS